MCRKCRSGFFLEWQSVDKKFQKNTRSDIKIQNIENIESTESIKSIESTEIIENIESISGTGYGMYIISNLVIAYSKIFQRRPIHTDWQQK